MKIGFTGTRFGMSNMQFAFVLRAMIEARPKEAHHGACIGADKQFHDIAMSQLVPVIVHPGVNKFGSCNTRAECLYYKESRPEKYFISRDKDIVDETDFLIACPQSRIYTTGGTWATIRHAIKTHRDCVIIYPDGNFDEYRKGVKI